MAMTTLSQSRITFSRLFARIRRGDLTRAFSTFVLVVIALELGGIWVELKGVRSEQVKNAFYALPPAKMARLRSFPDKQKAESYVKLLRSKIGGIEQNVTVEIDQPVDVRIDDQPVSVEIER
jgi:hypothetical protein